MGDIVGDGCVCRLNDIYSIHFPLTQNEITRLTLLGGKVDAILTDIACQIKSGMVDYEVEAMILYECAKSNIQCDVLLIGTEVNGEFRLLSNTGLWPSSNYTANGLTVSLPQIMMK